MYGCCQTRYALLRGSERKATDEITEVIVMSRGTVLHPASILRLAGAVWPGGNQCREGLGTGASLRRKMLDWDCRSWPEARTGTDWGL